MAPIAEQLREAIEQSGMSRYRISQLSGISEAVLSRFASGQTDLTLSNTDKLCAALGLKVVLKPEAKTRTSKSKKRRE
jgi:ribosome-binding protein aMBF1 (putative translation factor)